MAKNHVFLAVVLTICLYSSAEAFKESARDYGYNETCMQKVELHIRKELQASVSYLAMASWANEYSINRPGLAKMMFESAKEEREHAFKLLSYLRMRGSNEIVKIFPRSLEPFGGIYRWGSSLEVLQQALKMEKDVTESIKQIITYCAEAEDHHLADYLTGEFMEEQLTGQRKIAGLVNTLRGLQNKQPRLGDWIFDNQLLK